MSRAVILLVFFRLLMCVSLSIQSNFKCHTHLCYLCASVFFLWEDKKLFFEIVLLTDSTCILILFDCKPELTRILGGSDPRLVAKYIDGRKCDKTWVYQPPLHSHNQVTFLPKPKVWLRNFLSLRPRDCSYRIDG